VRGSLGYYTFNLYVNVKMRFVLPSMRERKRYVAFEVSGDRDFSFESVRKSVLDSAFSFLGFKGLSKCSLHVMSNFWDSKSGRGVLRVNRGCLDDVKSCLLLVSGVDGVEASVRSVLVSGSLKSLKSKLSEVGV